MILKIKILSLSKHCNYVFGTIQVLKYSKWSKNLLTQYLNGTFMQHSKETRYFDEQDTPSGHYLFIVSASL